MNKKKEKIDKSENNTLIIEREYNKTNSSIKSKPKYLLLLI